tara:strand:+ start:409 stop:597 length:189 start_codon:yes stop_codon:yes gene_type:complete
MKKKKGSGKKYGGSKGRPAVLSLGKGKAKRPAKARVGKVRGGKGGPTARKTSAKSRVRGRRY